MNTNTVNNTTSFKAVNVPIRGMNSEGAYIFLPYDPKAPISEAGKRVIKVCYKVAKQGKNAGVVKGKNSCLIVEPIVAEDVNNADVVNRLLPHVIAMCEAERDKIAKDFHLSGAQSVSQEALDINAIIASLEAEAVSGRMNKEIITSWFDSEVSDILTVLFSQKLGITETSGAEEIKKLDRFITVYRDKFCGLASNLVTYQIEEAKKLLEALDKCELDFDSDMIASKIREKLNKMLSPTNVEELLGF